MPQQNRMDTIKLHILSPEGTLVDAEVSLVTLPGMLCPFTVLPGHAPIVTALEKGNVRYVSEGKEQLLAIRDGFAQVQDNVVTVCVEV